jgi:hypothetical protein
MGRRPLLLLLLVTLGSILGIGIGEVVLRIGGFTYPVFGIYDELLGTAAPPHASGWMSQEGHAFVRFNSQGYRDRERTFEKPAATTRIAVLGDSFVQALQVDLDSTFVSVLQRGLDARPDRGGRTYEVLNFGVGGYGPAQELLLLENRIWAYDPDVILLALFTGNDIVNDSRPLELDPIRPFFVLRDGELVLDNSFRDAPRFRRGRTWPWRAVQALSRHSRFVQLLYEVRHRRVAARESDRRSAELRELDLREDTGLSPLLYRPPTLSSWKEAWEITEKILLRMQDDVESHGARLVVVTLSNAIQVHPDPEVRRAFLRRLEVDDLFYPDRRLREFGDTHGIEVLTLAPRLREIAESTGTCLHGFANADPCFGHWNERGHHAAGEILLHDLIQRGI